MRRYQPKHLAPASAPPPSYGDAEALGPNYNLYILPDDVSVVTDEDLERFPPLPLGSEGEARAWLDRASSGSVDKPRKKRRSLLWDLVYYVLLATLILGVFLFRGVSGGAPVSFMGFSAMRVLTASMQDVIPQGSLIITRSVDPQTLAVGDDITYMAAQDVTITHRIVDITEHYGDTGARAFVTQGVMNPNPDELRVPAANVVGKVVFHNLTLGEMLGFAQANWTWLAVLAVLFVGLAEALRVVARESKETEETIPPPRRLAGADKPT